jgi:hypothetical protein
MSGALLVHRGGIKVAREYLKTLPAPESTMTYKAVQHAHLVDVIEDKLNKNGLQIEKQEFAIMGEGGAKMFGVLTLKAQSQPDMKHAVGLRNSYNKSMAVGVITGGRVTVCDNMLFSSNEQGAGFHRKHTSGLVIEREVEEIVTRAIGNFGVLNMRIQQLKGVEVTPQFAKAFIGDAVIQDVIPANLYAPVVKEFLEPSHPEHKDPTAMNLHNAFTHHFKAPKMSPGAAFQATIKLAKMFKL